MSEKNIYDAVLDLYEPKGDNVWISGNSRQYRHYYWDLSSWECELNPGKFIGIYVICNQNYNDERHFRILVHEDVDLEHDQYGEIEKTGAKIKTMSSLIRRIRPINIKISLVQPIGDLVEISARATQALFKEKPTINYVHPDHEFTIDSRSTVIFPPVLEANPRDNHDNDYGTGYYLYIKTDKPGIKLRFNVHMYYYLPREPNNKHGLDRIPVPALVLGHVRMPWDLYIYMFEYLVANHRYLRGSIEGKKEDKEKIKKIVHNFFTRIKNFYQPAFDEYYEDWNNKAIIGNL